MVLTTNGHQLYYEDHGFGKAVVLLHHGLGSVQSWGAQIPALVGAGFHAIAYDRWGYGNSDPRVELDLPGFGEDICDLRALLDYLEVNQAVLVGHSDGGTLALIFAARFPESVSRLISVSAHVYVEPKMETGIRGVKAAYEESSSFRRGLQRLHGAKTEAVFRGWFEGWAKPQNRPWDMRPLLSTVTCPVLVVQGMQDEHATPQHARDISAALPQAELWLLPSAGHMLPQEHAEVFNKRMVEFINHV